MAKTGAIMNYDFGPKRHWRRWVWNRIGERVAAPRDALVVYLPGENNFDLPIAIGKGFQVANMIGVEHNGNAVKHLRGNGSLTINADFCDAVDAIARNRKIDVVFADLCCGLSPELSSRAFFWINSKHLNQSVFAFNMMRGRDKSANTMRNALSDVTDKTMKHRGDLLFSGCLVTMSTLVVSGECGITREEIAALDPEQPLAVKIAHRQTKLLNFWARRSDVALNSYRSESFQTFDSIVFKNPMRDLHDTDGLKSVGRAFNIQTNKDSVRSAARSVGAVMAHRTRRDGNHYC